MSEQAVRHIERPEPLIFGDEPGSLEGLESPCDVARSDLAIERFVGDVSDDRDRERVRLERAVTRCIQSFYSTAAHPA